MKKSALIFVIMLTGGTVLRAQTPVIWTGSTSIWSTAPPSAADAAAIVAALGASTPRIAAPTPATPLNERIVIVPAPAASKPLSETETRLLDRARHEQEQYARRHAEALPGIYRRALEPVPSVSELTTRQTELRETELVTHRIELERETPLAKADAPAAVEELERQEKTSRDVEKQEAEAAKKADDVAARLKAAQAALQAERDKGGR